MNTQSILRACKSSAAILADMDGETANAKKNGKYPLIFPEIRQKYGTKLISRVSEQELRQLFLYNFRKPLYCAIEIPTVNKYKLTGGINNYSCTKGKSALIDLTIFDFTAQVYSRLVNIEFKHSVNKEHIAKDLYKLVNEYEDGAIIFLLNNANKGTLCNNPNRLGLFNKLLALFSTSQMQWTAQKKSILIIVISLRNRTILHHEILQSDLANNLPQIFNSNQNKVDINQILGWNTTTF
jgi:hypothetical protein